MKLVVALALSANAFTPSTPGGAKPRRKVIPTSYADFEESMIPQAGDLVVEGKKGLDAFPGTNLEALLKENNIETLALCGFLTNCCVESSMRTAYEKGFNTVTLTDCCATTSAEGQAGATGGTFGMFSDPMTADDFVAKL